MENLIFMKIPNVVFATNLFINVPIILRYDELNLIEIIEEMNLGFTTQIPIYHSDGTFLAKINGTRIFATDEGKKAGLKIEKYPRIWACKMNNNTLFEIEHEKGDQFRFSAELYTSDGHFIKCKYMTGPEMSDINGKIQKIVSSMSNCTLKNVRIGVWLKKDGSCLIGVT